MTAPRIYTGAEAAALLAAYTTQPRVTFGDECLGGVPLCVDGRELLYTQGPDDEGDWIYVDRWESEMHAAAPDLAASVAHHAAETRREQGRVSGLVLLLDDEKSRRVAAESTAHRVTMERDGARLSLDAAHEARVKQLLELAEARAEVVRLRAALDAAHRLARRHGNAVDAMEEGREAEESNR